MFLRERERERERERSSLALCEGVQEDGEEGEGEEKG